MTVSPGRTVDDLVTLTGLSKSHVQRSIANGQMPGYKVGSAYWIPAEQFDLYARGIWRPAPKPQTSSVTPLDLIKTRKSA